MRADYCDATFGGAACTCIVIFFDITGGSCGMWSPSPISSCSVWVPGGSSMNVSVWPSPKCRWFLSLGIGSSSGGRRHRSAGGGDRCSAWMCRPGRRRNCAVPNHTLISGRSHDLAVVRPADIDIGVASARSVRLARHPARVPGACWALTAAAAARHAGGNEHGHASQCMSLVHWVLPSRGRWMAEQRR